MLAKLCHPFLFNDKRDFVLIVDAFARSNFLDLFVAFALAALCVVFFMTYACGCYDG